MSCQKHKGIGVLRLGIFVFCKDFTNKTKPLKHLLKKIRKYDWTKDHEKAFQTLQVVFTQGPILIAFIWAHEFHVHTTSSNTIIGPILTQNLDNNTYLPMY
jgi:erythromycin esterase-like protein